MVGLCGRQVCPMVCSQVCHCEAGLARVKWLSFYHQSLRELRKREGGAGEGTPDFKRQVVRVNRALHRHHRLNAKRRYLIQRDYPNLDLETGELRAVKPQGLKEQVLTFAFGERKPEQERERPVKFGQQTFKPLASPLAVAVLLIFFTLVIVSGLIINGGSITPHYSGDRDAYVAPDYQQDYFAGQ